MIASTKNLPKLVFKTRTNFWEHRDPIIHKDNVTLQENLTLHKNRQISHQLCIYIAVLFLYAQSDHSVDKTPHSKNDWKAGVGQ